MVVAAKYRMAEWRDLLFAAISPTADPSGQKAPRGMTVPK